MIKAIIFDCFGVLVGTGFKDTYRSAGGDPEKDREFIQHTLDTSNIGAITSRDMAKMMAEKIGTSVAEWDRAVAEAETPNTPILEYIETLRKSYKVAVLSNANVGTLQRKLSQEQLALFDEVVVSAEIGMIKPDKEIYVYAAEKLSVKPGECVFIDDIEIYCEGAKAVGMQAILYSDFVSMKQQLEKLLSNPND